MALIVMEIVPSKLTHDNFVPFVKAPRRFGAMAYAEYMTLQLVTYTPCP